MKSVLVVSPPLESMGGISKIAEKQVDITGSQFYFTHFSTGTNYILQLLLPILFVCKLITNDFDIIHIHTASGKSFYRKFIYMIASVLFKYKTIIHVHGGGFGLFSNKPTPKLLARILSNFDMVEWVFLSEMMIEELSPNFLCRKSASVISNFEFNRYTFSELPSEQSVTIKLCFVGRMVEEKGVLVLLDSVVKANSFSRKRFSLDLYGDGPLLNSLKEKYINDDLIVFHGWVESSSIPYCSYHLNCLPSLIEAMPLTIIESMMNGTPTLATRVGAVPNMIENDRTGWLIEAPPKLEDIYEIFELVDINSLVEVRSKVYEYYLDNYSEEHFLLACGRLYDGN